MRFTSCYQAQWQFLGFAGAFRRSELVAIDVEDCGKTPEGLTVNLKRAENDQDEEGRLVGILAAGTPSCRHRYPVKGEQWFSNGRTHHEEQQDCRDGLHRGFR